MLSSAAQQFWMDVSSAPRKRREQRWAAGSGVPLWMPRGSWEGPRGTTVPDLTPHRHQHWATLGRSGAWKGEAAQGLGGSLVGAKVQRWEGHGSLTLLRAVLSFAWATVTKYHRRIDLQSRNVLPGSSGGWEGRAESRPLFLASRCRPHSEPSIRCPYFPLHMWPLLILD